MGKKPKSSKTKQRQFDMDSDLSSSEGSRRDAKSSYSSSSSSSSDDYGRSTSTSDERTRAKGNKGVLRTGDAFSSASGPLTAVATTESKASLASAAGFEPFNGDSLVNLDDLSSQKANKVHWQTIKYAIRVEDSLAGLQRATTRDGAQGPRPINLNSGIEIKQYPASLQERLDALPSLATAEEYEANPARVSSPNYIVNEVFVQGHNSFPCDMEFSLDNIQGTSNTLFNSKTAGGPTRSLVFTCPAGKKFDNHRVMKNDYHQAQLAQMMQFAGVNEKNISDGVLDTNPHPETRRPRVLVPSTKERPHMVVATILKDFVNHPLCNSKMRRQIKERRGFPSEIIKPTDSKDFVFVDKELYNEYVQKCVRDLSQISARSDVANPHGHMTRAIFKPTFASGQPIPSASIMDAEEERLWDHPEGVHVGLVSEESKRNAFNKIGCCQFFVTVTYATTESVVQKVNSIASSSRRK